MNRHAIAADFANRSASERDELGTYLRDRFFEVSNQRGDDAELRALVEAVEHEPTANVDGLTVSWHPTARHKALRFVDADAIDKSVRDRFARPCPDAPHLAAVFADPRELSFRTYENIVALDRLFEAAPVELELADRAKLSKQGAVYSFTATPSTTTRSTLEKLDSLGLYVPPLNKASRGGERFIFHSALLAEALTAAVRKAMPKSLLGGFSHVNPIFRCNRFEPDDDRFHRHHDTPYYDATRKHVSRYTLLLYVTGGSGAAGAPGLDVPGHAALEQIAPFTCVILDQQYEHEGAPFRDGRKVFLRTELVFTDPDIRHDDQIAQRFSKACYWTGESIFEPELARYADAYYNQVAAAHWGASAVAAPREPFVHKAFRGVHFVANGYDFWFAKHPALSLAECAAITLLDYFNCKIGGHAFRSLCTSTVIRDAASESSWIGSFLQGQHTESAVGSVDKAALFPEAEATDDVCCPFHGWPRFDASRHVEIVDLYKRAQTFAKAHIGTAPILVMGQEVALDPSRFVVEDGRINVLAKESLAPVNFAACWNSGGTPENYVDVDAMVDVVQLLVPPILYRETNGCYHLQFDFFRNSWMVQHAQLAVPVPKIRLLDSGAAADDLDEDEQRPWIDAVDPALVSRSPRSRKRVATLWWAEDTKLMRELFSDYRSHLDDESDDSEADESEDEEDE